LLNVRAGPHGSKKFPELIYSNTDLAHSGSQGARIDLRVIGDDFLPPMTGALQRLLAVPGQSLEDEIYTLTRCERKEMADLLLTFIERQENTGPQTPRCSEVPQVKSGVPLRPAVSVAKGSDHACRIVQRQVLP
jgi:hypothetical protein